MREHCARDVGPHRRRLIRPLPGRREIDENIERREITAVERADLIARRVELLEARRRLGEEADQSAQLAPIEKSKRADGKGHRPESGVRQTARELGMPRDKVRRSLAIASLSPEAKAKAVDLGLDDFIARPVWGRRQSRLRGTGQDRRQQG